MVGHSPYSGLHVGPFLCLCRVLHAALLTGAQVGATILELHHLVTAVTCQPAHVCVLCVCVCACVCVCVP